VTSACPLFPRKRAFETEALADEAAALTSEKLGRKVRAYECKACGCFHLTKRKRKVNRPLTARLFKKIARAKEIKEA
jgi:hypothetical protein